MAYDPTIQRFVNEAEQRWGNPLQNRELLYPYGIKLPINLGFNGIMEATGNAIQKVWHHEASVDAALAEAERQANKAIAEAAK